MQKNDIKSCRHTEAKKKKQEQGEGPLTQDRKKTFFLGSAFGGSFFSGLFLLFFCRHILSVSTDKGCNQLRCADLFRWLALVIKVIKEWLSGLKIKVISPCL
ncbi:MAG: hypothetical protein JRF02_01480 [Deltaproteobacteria bacterium]|jgi:hypothetical protein|nr:hypothetical protein [Deltaproteobacteria bacterium]